MTATIKAMKLYSQVERIHNDLASVGIGRSDEISLETLTAFDQLHYHGTDAVDEAARRLNVGPRDRVLDIGAGFGGPARWLAARTGAHVTAVELQPDLDAAAADLTTRTGLAGKVAHVCGDIHDVDLPQSAFTGAISYLALYHIPDRDRVFAKLSDAMAPRGRIYVEDLYVRKRLTQEEDATMRHALFGNSLATRVDYENELVTAGFTDICFEDRSEDWGSFCRSRLDGFRAAAPDKTRVHGTEVVAALDEFYQTMVDLFDGGNMGGVCLTARAPG